MVFIFNTAAAATAAACFCPMCVCVCVHDSLDRTLCTLSSIDKYSSADISWIGTYRGKKNGLAKTDCNWSYLIFQWIYFAGEFFNTSEFINWITTIELRIYTHQTRCIVCTVCSASCAFSAVYAVEAHTHKHIGSTCLERNFIISFSYEYNNCFCSIL